MNKWGFREVRTPVRACRPGAAYGAEHMFPRTSNAARPSILHRALRTAVAFATLEAVVPEPGESAATRGAGPSGAAPGSPSPSPARPIRTAPP